MELPGERRRLTPDVRFSFLHRGEPGRRERGDLMLRTVPYYAQYLVANQWLNYGTPEGGVVDGIRWSAVHPYCEDTQLDVIRVRSHKWHPEYDRIYTVRRLNLRSGVRWSCDCPDLLTCKHIYFVQQARQGGRTRSGRRYQRLRF